MMRIGLICAMPDEFESCRAILRDSAMIPYMGWEIHTAQVSTNVQLYGMMSGVGKVNAALAVSILKQAFEVEFILSYGIAGILDKRLQLFDQVIGSELAYHDCFRPNQELSPEHKRMLSMVGPFETNPVWNEHLIASLQPMLPALPEAIAKRTGGSTSRLLTGKIVTGDIPCGEEKTAIRLREAYEAVCVDMEGAGIAQACAGLKLPYLVYRIMSDYANEHSHLYIMRNGPYLYSYLSLMLPLLIGHITDNGEFVK